MPRGLIAYVYVVPEGWAVDITQDSQDLVEQLIQLFRSLGYEIPRRLLIKAGYIERKKRAA